MKQIKIILTIIFCIGLMGCEKVVFEDVPEFDKTEILSLKAYAKDKSSILVGNPEINTETSTIIAKVKAGANLSDLFVTCTITSGSTLSPALDGYQDWSVGHRTFTVVSASGKRTATWEIKLEKE